MHDTRRRRPARSRGGAAVFVVGVTVLLATGCVADPPPPTVVGRDDPSGATVRQTEAGVSLAVDRLDEGLNPHLVADQGQDTDLFTSLTLPSVFRADADGVLDRDPALAVSAEVITRSPFVVRYTLRPQAQWSDGVPVGAEDFEYLWRQMRSQPGTVDPEGYDHVVDVRSGAGGKVVDVEFDGAYERWRTLFSGLLPAHLLKDAPGGFQKALSKGAAASAGPFMVNKSDLGRGVVEFVRNDRYWATPPVLDQIIVRRVAGTQALGQALRAGPGSVASVADTPVNRTVVRTVPGRSATVAQASAQLELGLDTTSPWMTDPVVRRAVAAAVTPSVIGSVVTGDDEHDTSNFPFPPGTGTPAAGVPASVPGLLRSAGFEQGDERWTRDGTPLSVTVGVSAGDLDAATAAYTVVDQLRGAGIGAKVWEVDPEVLYSDVLPHGLVDAVVTRQRTDTDAVVAAVSRYSCPTPGGGGSGDSSGPPSRTATTKADLSPPAPDTGTPTSSTSTTPTISATPTRVGEPGAPARASGVSGICDPELDAALREASSAPDPAAALSTAGRRVADLALRVPLVRPRHLLARSADVAGLPSGSTPTVRFDWVAFDAAPRWRRN